MNRLKRLLNWAMYGEYRWPILFGVLAVIFALLFWYDYTRTISVGDRTVIGYITYKHNRVQRRFQDRLVWTNLENRSPLTNQDTIRSEDLSDAHIHLNDGTVIKIDENSMVILDFTGSNPTIDFMNGGLQIEQGEGGSGLVINSGDNSIDASDSDLRLQSGEGNLLDLIVNRGEAMVNSGGQVRSVAMNQKAVMSDQGVDVRDIHLIPEEPRNQQIVPSDYGAVRIPFQWKVRGEFGAVTFQISRHRSFSSTMYSQTVNGSGLVAQLPPGTYYWRLFGRDRAGNEEVSEVRKVFVVVNSPVRLATPANGETFTYVNEPPLITFNWSGNALASSYEVLIGRNADLSDASSITATTTTLARRDFSAGRYYWQVVSKPSMSGVPDRRSPLGRFDVQQREGFPAPEIQRPVANQTLAEKDVTQGVLFVWKGLSEIKSYTVQVATDAGFENQLVNQTVSNNFLQAGAVTQKGTYFWRVRGSGGETESDFTAPVRFRIDTEAGAVEGAAQEVIRNMNPANGSRIDLANRNSLTFNWQGDDRARDYEFKLYRVVNGREVEVFSRRVTDESITMTDLRALAE
ncbi:MAG: FecR domain-containing protein, partial [Leptospiraceae bacterium]|nr:FecR domain-containing protein [Leptospiraceae bacterium]